MARIRQNGGRSQASEAGFFKIVALQQHIGGCCESPFLKKTLYFIGVFDKPSEADQGRSEHLQEKFLQGLVAMQQLPYMKGVRQRGGQHSKENYHAE